MDYTLDYLLEHQDKEQHKFFGADNFKNLVERQKEIKGLNNQIRIINDFSNSKLIFKWDRRHDFFLRLDTCRGDKDRYAKIRRQFMIPMELNYQGERKLQGKDWNDYKFEDFIFYLKSLAYYFSIEMCKQWDKKDRLFYPSRWNIDRGIRLNEHHRKRWEEFFNDNKTIEKGLKDPNFEWDKLDLDWHMHLGHNWTLVINGLARLSQKYLDNLYEMWKRTYKEKNLLSNSFVAIKQFQYDMRQLGSITWIRSLSHYQLGNDKINYESLKEYAYYWQNDKPSNMQNHYNVHNRVFEAAILLYRINPNEENKKNVFKLLHHIINKCRFQDDETETTKERLLACFDFIQTMYKDQYEEYISRT